MWHQIHSAQYLMTSTIGCSRRAMFTFSVSFIHSHTSSVLNNQEIKSYKSQYNSTALIHDRKYIVRTYLRTSERLLWSFEEKNMAKTSDSKTVAVQTNPNMRTGKSVLTNADHYHTPGWVVGFARFLCTHLSSYNWKVSQVINIRHVQSNLYSLWAVGLLFPLHWTILVIIFIIFLVYFLISITIENHVEHNGYMGLFFYLFVMIKWYPLHLLLNEYLW